MADTAKRAGPTQLTTSAVTQYTVAAGKSAVLRGLQACNNTASDVTFTLSVGADAAGTRLFDTVTVRARSSFQWTGFVPLVAGELLQALAGTGSALTLTLGLIESDI